MHFPRMFPNSIFGLWIVTDAIRGSSALISMTTANCVQVSFSWDNFYFPFSLQPILHMRQLSQKQNTFYIFVFLQKWGGIIDSSPSCFFHSQCAMEMIPHQYTESWPIPSKDWLWLYRCSIIYVTGPTLTAVRWF